MNESVIRIGADSNYVKMTLNVQWKIFSIFFILSFLKLHNLFCNTKEWMLMKSNQIVSNHSLLWVTNFNSFHAFDEMSEVWNPFNLRLSFFLG